MGKLEIEFSREAARQYRKLPKGYKSLVDIALSKLSQGSGLDLKPIEGKKDIYRIRVGKYRILLSKFDNVALISRIAARGNAYK